MSRRVYITRIIHDRATETLRAAGCDVETNPLPRDLAPDELRRAAANADGVLCMLRDRIDSSLFAAAPRAKVFANYAVGFDNMDVAAATKAGVALSNTPDVLTDATAEMAWALLFAAARRVCEGDRLTRAGEFHGWEPLMLLGHQVSGRTLGIVGAGRIGIAMAKRAAGFDMRILYTRRSGPSPEMEKLGARCASLEELLRECDFISLHAPLNSESRHMIGASQLAIMKPNAVLINTGRGPLIDEKALVQALKEKRIAVAGLDVYEREPAIEEGLRELENVVLAPHIGSATFEAREQMAELAAQNILDAFAGRVPRTCINPGFMALPKIT